MADAHSSSSTRNRHQATSLIDASRVASRISNVEILGRHRRTRLDVQLVRSSSGKIDVVGIQGRTIADRGDARAVDVKTTNTHVHRSARAPSR